MNETREKKITNILLALHDDLAKLSLSELRRLESHFNGPGEEMTKIRDLLRLYSDSVTLKRYRAVQTDDKYDLELQCTECKEAICDIEDDDSMDVLVCMMVGHDKDKHREKIG